MSYVNLKTKEGHPFRVTFSNTANHAPLVGDIPANLRGYLTEGLIQSSAALLPLHGSEFVDLSNPQRPVVGSLDDAISFIRQTKVPYVPIEPTVTEKGAEGLNLEAQKLHPLRGRLGVMLVQALRIEGEGEIVRESLRFKVLESFMNAIGNESLFIHTIRDLLMAQRAIAFANHRGFLKVKDQDGPYVLNSGIGHAGVVRALEMDETERLKKIKGHKSELEKFFDMTKLHVGYYETYEGYRSDPSRKWRKRIFEDPMLKGI